MAEWWEEEDALRVAAPEVVPEVAPEVVPVAPEAGATPEVAQEVAPEAAAPNWWEEENALVQKDVPEPADPDWADYLLGVHDVGLSIATSIPAEIVGGLTGIVESVRTSPGEAGGAVEALQEAMTYTPRTEAGKRIMAQVGKVLTPVGEAFGEVESTLGDATLEATGSPELAAIAHTLPTAVLEALGLGVAQRAARATARAAKAAPDLTPPARSALDLVEEARKADIDSLVASVKADPDMLRAADELGIDLNPAHYSTVEEFRQMEQALKSQHDSVLRAKEIEIIETLNTKVDELMDGMEGGRPAGKSILSDEVKTTLKTTIDDLDVQAESLYDQVSGAVPDYARVIPHASQQYLRGVLKELGGDVSGLSRIEKELYDLIRQKRGPTYVRLDRLRKDIARAYNKEGPFKDSLPPTLEGVYKALRRDQDGMAGVFEQSDALRQADNLVDQRKVLQKSAVALFNSELKGSLVPKLLTAGKKLPEGDTSELIALMDALPEAQRATAAATILDDLFSVGKKRGDREFGQQFLNVFEGLNRNPGAKRELFKHLPSDAERRFNAIGKVVSGIEKSKIRNPRGLTADILAAFEKGNVVQRVLGWGGRFLTYKTMGLAGGRVGSKLEQTIRDATKRSGVADRVLASDAFNLAMRKGMEGKTAAANKILEGSPEWQVWKELLPDLDKGAIATVGAIAWLTRPTEDEPAELNQPGEQQGVSMDLMEQLRAVAQ